jgi:hypothetical protein
MRIRHSSANATGTVAPLLRPRRIRGAGCGCSILVEWFTVYLAELTCRCLRLAQDLSRGEDRMP